jgi:hypothetical protein
MAALQGMYKLLALLRMEKGERGVSLLSWGCSGAEKRLALASPDRSIGQFDYVSLLRSLIVETHHLVRSRKMPPRRNASGRVTPSAGAGALSQTAVDVRNQVEIHATKLKYLAMKKTLGRLILAIPTALGRKNGATGVFESSLLTVRWSLRGRWWRS